MLPVGALTGSKMTWVGYIQRTHTFYWLLDISAQNKFETANQATKRFLLRLKCFYNEETFHCMLKFNILYNVMVNYTFLSYEYIFPRFKFAHRVLKLHSL